VKDSIFSAPLYQIELLELFTGKARQGKARQGKARQGKARQGKARQGKAKIFFMKFYFLLLSKKIRFFKELLYFYILERTQN
jgi:hypothetical protein